MAMFDWNDEELTNIIWGKVGENDDHIVPYSEQNGKKIPVTLIDGTQKEINQENSYPSPAEQKKPIVIINTEQEDELVSSSKYDGCNALIGFDLDSWPDRSDTSVINSVKAGQDCLGTSAANNITNSKDETGQFDKDSYMFRSISEGSEHCDHFVDYGWANIGSFDDLDSIFSNNPLFGSTSVGNADETWSSSNDLAGSGTRFTLTAGDSSELPFSAHPSSDRSEVKTECILDSNPSSVSVHGMLKSHGRKDVQNLELEEKRDSLHKKVENESTAMPNEYSEKGSKQKRLFKGNKVDEKREMKQMHKKGSVWSSSGNALHQVNNQYATSMVNSGPPSVICQQSQYQRTNPVQQKPFISPHFSSNLYENMVYHYPTMSSTPQFHSAEGIHQSANQSSRMKSVDPAVQPSIMSPREKIEKLRRQQQLRAILAIQKQQQQLGNQTSGVGHSVMDGKNIEIDENISSFQAINPNTSIEVNDTSSVNVPSGNCSVEEPEIYQLQDTISKLDNRIRLCIRDSLFRLAKSAMQRQCPTSSDNRSNRDEFISDKDVIHERFTRTPDVETDTNPIDRTVAHLLFHRPQELSRKLLETPTDVSFEGKNTFKTISPGISAANGHFPDSFVTINPSSPQGSKTSIMYLKNDQYRNSTSLDAIENASNKESAEARVTNMESS